MEILFDSPAKERLFNKLTSLPIAEEDQLTLLQMTMDAVRKKQSIDEISTELDAFYKEACARYLAAQGAGESAS